MIDNPAIKSWQKKVDEIRIVMPRSGWSNTRNIKIKNDIKVKDKKYFLPLIDWEMPQEVKIIKNGLITSDGWNEKLNIFNHLFEPLTWYSKKYRDSNRINKIIKLNNAIFLIFLSFCCEKNKIKIIPRIKKIVWRFINKKFWLTEKESKTPKNPRIRINIKLSLSIEFHKFFIIIYLFYLELID